MSGEEFDEIIDDDEIDQSVALNKAKDELIKRCEAAGYKVEEKGFILDEDEEKYLSVEFPNGREKRPLSFFRLERINELLNIHFEKYVFLGDFVAICSYEDNYIEALSRPFGPTSRNYLRKNVFGLSAAETEDEDIEKSIELKPKINETEITLVLGPASKELLAFSRVPVARSGSLSLTIKGIQTSKHNDALEILSKISNSLFFQIDLESGVPFSLVKGRRPLRTRRSRPSANEEVTYQFPETEYDNAPISLFWYAKSSRGMPLLQFLAFYQVIEFYFSSFSQEEAKRKVRAILKDPTFRVDRDTDVTRILSAISRKGKGFGDERSQLRATFQECLDSDSLRKFYCEIDDRTKFFSAKQKGLTDLKIPISSTEADLRDPTAELIYDIRCKIVHTKADVDGEFDLLLPYSKEAELLYHDIELLEYIARQVLIAASSPLQY